MEFAEALQRRRSTRSFLDTPVEQQLIREVLAASLRAPSAGNTWALSMLVLTQGARERYWSTTMSPSVRSRFRWQGLFNAPVLIVVMTDPQRYPQRYSEPDKVSTGLGDGSHAWPIPYWYVDAGAAIQSMLLCAGAVGLDSLLFGAFGHEPALKRQFEIDPHQRIVGVIALGYGDDSSRLAGRSASRVRPPLQDFVTSLES